MQAKETAQNARRKMGNYLDNENQDTAANLPEMRQRLQERLQVLQTEEPHAVKPLSLLEKVAGVTGLEPAASGVTGQQGMAVFCDTFNISTDIYRHLPTMTYIKMLKVAGSIRRL